MLIQLILNLSMERQLLKCTKIQLKKDDSVLIIDDLIATGGTAEAAAKLVEMSNAKLLHLSL